jgi:hypothetical protein
MLEWKKLPESPEDKRVFFKPIDNEAGIVADVLIELFELMKADQLGRPFTVDRDIHGDKFHKLAKWLIKDGLDPKEYMKYAFDLYQPRCYINMVSSRKAFEAFRASYKEDIDYLGFVAEEAQIIKRTLNKFKTKSTQARILQAQLKPLTWYFYCKAENLEEEQTSRLARRARLQWILLNDEGKEAYARMFDIEEEPFKGVGL